MPLDLAEANGDMCCTGPRRPSNVESPAQFGALRSASSAAHEDPRRIQVALREAQSATHGLVLYRCANDRIVLSALVIALAASSRAAQTGLLEDRSVARSPRAWIPVPARLELRPRSSCR